MIRFEVAPVFMGKSLSICPPKKRPRFWYKNGRSGTYHEPNYTKAQKQVLEQLKALNLPSKFPTPCEISVTFYGDLNADADNAIGFLYDVLVIGGYLPDDSIKYVSKGSFEWVPVLVPWKNGKGFKKSPNQQDKLRYWSMLVEVRPAQIVPVMRKPIRETTQRN